MRHDYIGRDVKAMAAAHFTLEMYFEVDEDRDFAEQARKALLQLLTDLAPHVVLDIQVMKAHAIARTTIDPVTQHQVPYHPASRPGRQTMLITIKDVGAQGWGWQECCVVNKQRMITKAQSGGIPGEIPI